MNEAVQAYIGLGGNVGDVANTLMEALHGIDALPQTSVRRQSAVYRSPAWGLTEQAPFLNQVAELRTRLDARSLLDRLLEIEARFGRVRGQEQRWGPRTLDLDLLLFGEVRFDEPGLHVPHPFLHERAFVLVPLAEIAARLEIPGRGKVGDLLAGIDATGVEPISSPSEV